jgi:hypothetical protein
MKSPNLQNKLAGYTGNILLYGYRVFILVKGTMAHRKVKKIPGKGHILFTSSQFTTPCYN